MRHGKLLFTLLITIVLPFSNCSEQIDSPVLEGPYLGQNPPGETVNLFAPNILSSGSHELDITITPDGNDIFFTRSGPDWSSAILYYKRINEIWEGPFVPSFSERYPGNYPFVSPDGSRIYYNSQEPVQQANDNSENNNIFVSVFSDTGWSKGKLLDPELAINHTESYVSISANGNIYFGARYEEGFGGCDLYMSEFNGSNYNRAVNLGPSINSEHNEFHLYVSPDESYLLFDARRPDGFGGNDLYVSRKNDEGTWSMAQNLGDKINTEFSESRPYVSPDGKYLFFCSNRVEKRDENENEIMNYENFEKRITGPGNGNQDIYWVDLNVIFELIKK